MGAINIEAEMELFQQIRIEHLPILGVLLGIGDKMMNIRPSREDDADD